MIYESRDNKTKQIFNNARTPVAAIIANLYDAMFLKKSCAVGAQTKKTKWCDGKG